MMNIFSLLISFFIASTIASTALTTSRNKALDVRRLSDITQLRTALELYQADAGLGRSSYPWGGGVILGRDNATTLSSRGFTNRAEAQEPIYMVNVPQDPDSGSRHGPRYYQYWSDEQDYVIQYLIETNSVGKPEGLNYISRNNEGLAEDTDHDGLPNIVEAMFGSDSTQSDTDGDGYEDAQELEARYNPGGMGKIWYTKKSDNEIIAVVRDLPVVREWRKQFSGKGDISPTTGGRAIIVVDHADHETAVVHVYEQLRDHTATFAWYEVKRRTGVARHIGKKAEKQNCQADAECQSGVCNFMKQNFGECAPVICTPGGQAQGVHDIAFFCNQERVWEKIKNIGDRCTADYECSQRTGKDCPTCHPEDYQSSCKNNVCVEERVPNVCERQGLKRIFATYHAGDDRSGSCSSSMPMIQARLDTVCAPCGNGVCDTALESRCNCPEDCK